MHISALQLILSISLYEIIKSEDKTSSLVETMTLLFLPGSCQNGSPPGGISTDAFSEVSRHLTAVHTVVFFFFQLPLTFQETVISPYCQNDNTTQSIHFLSGALASIMQEISSAVGFPAVSHPSSTIGGDLMVKSADSLIH